MSRLGSGPVNLGASYVEDRAAPSNLEAILSTMAPERWRGIHEILRLGIEFPGIKLAMLERAHLYTLVSHLRNHGCETTKRFDITYVDSEFWFLILARFWRNQMSDDQ